MAETETDPELGRESSTQPHIRIRGLTKRYGDHVAVADVSLDVFRGELFSLLGASGCGKTTLLRLIAGFVAPDAGEITIDGADMLALPPYARPVNMMFQSYALFPHMNVEDNVAFGLKRDGVAKPEIARRVGEALELVQMDRFAGRKPAQLSGGQRQRVALARSLVKRPKVLLLDEPLSALDRKLREATRLELVNIQHQVGVTFVLVTHDQEEAMTMSTRIAVMDHGRIMQVGSPAAIYERPASRFVADFIGSVNLFDGMVTDITPAGLAIDCAEAGATLVAPATGEVGIGDSVCLAIRPERLCLASLAEADERVGFANQLSGEIKEIAYRGDSRVYRVALQTGRVVKVAVPSLGTSAEESLHIGDAVTLGWERAAGALVAP